jgi:hypothetical protein
LDFWFENKPSGNPGTAQAKFIPLIWLTNYCIHKWNPFEGPQ